MAVLRPVLLVKDLPYSWRRLRSGLPGLAGFASAEPHPQERELVAYLRQGEVVGVCADTTLAFDVLSPPNRIEARDHLTAILTDGVWGWWGALAYYVERYHVRLPEEFRAHAEATGWRIAPGSVKHGELDFSEFDATEETLATARAG